MGGYPAGRDRWGGKRVVGGMLPRINFGADVWGESSIMTGVYHRWCSSTLHIGWGLCDCVCQVLVCRGRYGLGGVGSSLHSGIEFGRSRTDEGSSGGKEEGGGAGVRSRPASARTILLFHIIRARPSKQPRMVGSTLGVYSFGLIFVSARTNKRHHHHHEALLPGSGLGTNCLQTLGSSPGLFRVPYCV